MNQECCYIRIRLRITSTARLGEVDSDPELTLRLHLLQARRLLFVQNVWSALVVADRTARLTFGTATYIALTHYRGTRVTRSTAEVERAWR